MNEDLDMEIIDGLREIESEDPGFARELVEIYARDSSIRMAELRTAVEASDTTAIAAIAHALKGASRSIGARRVGDLAEALERQAHRPEPGLDPRAVYEQLRGALERTRPRLESLLMGG